jgi:putative addiction module antidote
MTGIKLRAIGNSVGVVLPKEILARLKVGEGDTLYVTDAPGGVMLTPVDPALEEQLRVGREVMRRYRNVLRELAK